jgi:hypothetical protein
MPTVRDTPTCFFDVLPVHPQPEPMEAFTSYLTRLGEANRMSTIGELFITAFPNTSYRPGHATRVLSDYSTLAFGALPQAAMCSETALRATTLFHFGQKFGRLPLPHTLRGFFQGSVASHRRFCPLCLAEHLRPHYSLLWQFLCLPGCLSHGCHFLEACGHCGQRLPLLPSRPRITTCSMCRADLRSLRPPLLSKEESKQTLLRTHDVTFLIAPHNGEESEERAKCIGLQLAHLRRMRGLSTSEVALHLQTDKRGVSGMEAGTAGRGIIFSHYVGYADYLGISLSMLYEASRSSQSRSQILEEEWVERVKTAIQQLESRALPISYRAVAEIIGITGEYLKTFPRVSAILASHQGEHSHHQSQRFQQEQKAIFEQVQAALGSLEAQGSPLNVRTIVDVTGLSHYKLRTYLRGTPLLKKIVGENDYYNDGTQKVSGREKELMPLVQSTIQEFQSQGQPITRRAIAEKIGLSRAALYAHAAIRELVKEYTRPVSQGYGEVELVEQVQAALHTLTSQGQAIGYRSVGQLIGVSQKVLQSSLGVRTVLAQAIEHTSQDPSKAKVVALVRAALERLEAQGEIIEYQSVRKMVGISQSVLRRHVQVRALLDEARKKQQSEEEVLKRVNRALQTLTLSGQPVGYQTVSQTTHLSQKVLERYESVRKLIEENADHQQREREVLAKVQKTMKALSTLGEPITLSSIKKRAHLTNIMLERYPQVREILAPFIEAPPDEHELVSRVQTAIQQLRTQNSPVTLAHLREMTGASERDLRRDPRVRVLLQKAREDRLHQQRQQREEDLLIGVKLAIQELVSRGGPVTLTAISQEVQLGLKALKQYPQVRETIASIGKRDLSSPA